MRILVISKAHRFINPTRALLLASLDDQFVVVGPGYGPVHNTVREYLRSCGPFDGLVLDSCAYLRRPDTGLPSWPHANARTFADVFEHFGRIVVLNLLDDFHGSTPAQFRAMFDPRVFVLSCSIGQDNYRYERMLAARRESWCPADIERMPRSVAPGYTLFPHAIADEEFASPREMRRNAAAVLGVQYFVRQRVASVLKQQGVHVVTGDDWRFRILRAVNGRTGRLAHAYRREFHRALDSAKVGVTCSGTVGYPIRKFFEIPARRAVLVAEFFDNPDRLGFRDRENCVALHNQDGSDAAGIVPQLLADDVERRRIAEAGYELIWSRHRICHRVQQLREVTEAVAADDLVSTRWEDGSLRLIRKSAQAVSNHCAEPNSAVRANAK